jgi:hypothetical protein
MKFKLFTAALIAVAAVGAMALPAAATTHDVTITTTIRNHADNGHGSPSLWARDSFKRMTTVHQNADKTYTVTLADSGTFEAIKHAGSPSGAAGVQIADYVSGAFTGHLVADVTGTLKSPAALSNLNGNTFNDQNNTTRSTSWWIKMLFKSTTGEPSVTSYRYDYVRPKCEHWVDSSAPANNDGQGPKAGNIVGKACHTKPGPTPTPSSPSTGTPAPTVTPTVPTTVPTTPGEAPAPIPVRNDLPVTG